MSQDGHLVLRQLTLLPGGEWNPAQDGWVVSRSASGVGYWLGKEANRQITPGCMLLIPSGTNGILRASSLGPLSLEFFLAQPRLLSGFLAVREWEALENQQKVKRDAVVFGEEEAPARQFAEVAAQIGQPGLMVRCKLLQIWAEAIAGLNIEASNSDQPNQCPEVRVRLRHLLEQISEVELASVSLTELATRVHCSERHFSRLFHEECGVPLRSRQTQIRLLRAGQLLADCDTKVIDVAFECGFKHLGLFNAMFKKHFGMTPSQWRGRARPSKARRAHRSPAFRFA